jgi:hypothetical protein
LPEFFFLCGTGAGTSDPSRGTGENAEIVNVYAAWDGVTGLQGVRVGVVSCRGTALHLVCA